MDFTPDPSEQQIIDALICSFSKQPVTGARYRALIASVIQIVALYHPDDPSFKYN